MAEHQEDLTITKPLLPRKHADIPAVGRSSCSKPSSTEHFLSIRSALVTVVSLLMLAIHIQGPSKLCDSGSSADIPVNDNDFCTPPLRY